MTISSDTFLAEYPEFSGVAGSAVERRVAQALATISESRLGVYYEDAVYLWCAHYLYLRFDVGEAMDANQIIEQENQGVTTSQGASTSGLTSSTSVSALTASDNPVEADLARTNYGLQYLSLLRQTLSPMALCS